ncbi:GIN domain-containing protein [Ohtaekwangia kribbensis]|jgi:hypothetical protein|uniref:GIN domain-containing protein n=1 Tax=Ohtaekwangia kribbensis TaxID=688913 RepID=A0ABW3KF13_9BACT
MKMIKITLASLLFAIATLTYGQEEITKDLRSFNRVIASPRINVILEEGDHESIRLVYSNVSADKINIEVKGKTLRLYLDDARVTDKLERENWGKNSVYRNATITAYVTYRQLKHLEIRGAQELTCKSELKAKKFKLKAYGENEITLASINTEYLKTSFYGENELKIKGGTAEYQKYRLFGENKIDTQALKSFSTITNIYGESKIKLTTQDELRVNSFGESRVSYNGDAQVSKGLIFGRAHIDKIY